MGFVDRVVLGSVTWNSVFVANSHVSCATLVNVVTNAVVNNVKIL
jgi:hypothetical protein